MLILNEYQQNVLKKSAQREQKTGGDVGELINICLEPVEQVNRFISNR